jgi:CheY-like chemotaxis protein
VLLVEDEPGVRTLVRRVLEKCGYAVVETRSAVEALQCLRERSFTALVTDVLMPQMSGPQLVQRARELYPKIPALLMTGYSEDVLDGVEIPGCALIRKPFTPEALADQLDRLIAATSGPDL